HTCTDREGRSISSGLFVFDGRGFLSQRTQRGSQRNAKESWGCAPSALRAAFEEHDSGETNMTTSKPIAIYYEHPDWFRLLFAEMDRRGIPYAAIDAPQHQYDPDEDESEYALLFNRMSPSAYLRGNGNGILYTINYLEHLDRLGTRVINGRAAFSIEISKALQLSLLRSLGLRYPRARVINHPSQVVS